MSICKSVLYAKGNIHILYNKNEKCFDKRERERERERSYHTKYRFIIFFISIFGIKKPLCL